MALPASFAKGGFTSVSTTGRSVTRLRNGRILKPLMISTEGEPDSGKTEFIWSIPGPSIMLCVDRGYEPALDNATPPPTRNLENWAIKAISIAPLSVSDKASFYAEYFVNVRKEYYAALDIPEAVCVAMDGDSDFWELHKLAQWGKVTGIFPQTKYGPVYAEKRAMIAKAWDKGKIIISTNKIKDDYETVYGPDGVTPLKESDGSDKRQKSGTKSRQGFPDQNYLYQIRLLHIRKPHTTKTIEKGPMAGKIVKVPGQWGIRILGCKVNVGLEGHELWGADCCFRSLVKLVYPNVDIRDFGFAD